MSPDSSSSSPPTAGAQSFRYEEYDPKHHDLFMRTWGGYIAKGNAKSITEDQLRLLYSANPAGNSILTIIEEGGVWIGAISAIATDIALPDGSAVTAYQIGDFMVDPKQQGRGLGGKLLRELTRFLVENGLRVYTFPNTRSVGVFLKQSYVEIRSIPMVVYPLLPAAAARGLTLGGKIMVRDVSIDVAGKIADELLASSSMRGIIAKSGDYLAWRYSRMRDSRDYCFSIVERADRDAPSLVVWSPFRYHRVTIQVVVDVISDPRYPPPLCEVAGKGMRRGALLGLNNVESGPGWSLPAFSIRVPRKYDPRPARLLVPPNDPASARLFSDCRFTTGDWMGF